MMRLVRIGLPILICVGGIVLIAVEPDRNGLEGGLLIVSAGLSVWLLNWLYRVGVAGERERDEEDRAREYFDRHGVWPDEVPAQRRPDAGESSPSAGPDAPRR